MGREFSSVLGCPSLARPSRWALPRLLLVFVFVFALLASVRPAAAAPVDILLGVNAGAPLGDLLGAAGALAAPRSLGEPGVYQVLVADQARALATLRQSPLVRYAEPDGVLALAQGVARTQDEDSAGAGNHWGLDRIGAASAWTVGDGAGVTVAVLDTGVSASQPELAGRVLPGYDFVANHPGAADDAGHGTFVAGIIGAARETDGTAGVAPDVTILPVKILDQNGVGSTANFVAGINYAVSQGARVINISAGGIDDSQALEDALRNAEMHGAVVVAATGNDGIDAPSYPAAVSSVLAVSASDQHDAVPGFATYGAYVDLAAPGVDIASTWWSAVGGDSRTVASGTSAAAPFVSGAAALLLGARPGLAPAGVRELLEASAADIEQPGIDARSGFGRLDAALAVRLASTTPLAGTVSLPTVAGAERLTFSSGGFQPNEAVTLLVQDDLGSRSFTGYSADGAGDLSVDLGPAASFPSDALTVSAIGTRSGLLARGSLQLARSPVVPAFAPLAPVPSTSDRLYFPETGHTLSGGFLAFWQAHGGLAVFGYPISEEFGEQNPDSGQADTVQYFERNRFEYHPELAGTPYAVSLGRLGSELAPQSYPSAPAPLVSDPGTRYFPETGHTLGGAFLGFWQAQGGLAIFGYPTSEPFEQNGRLVQYFERARFELHPESNGSARVLLGRLGVDLAYQHEYLR
ncbi:MAG TPA: S8 family serine peptidase [Thermomicrobiaceae bacterium]|nr:S8 family serine peptidase [Thermomicrobiaceae bacterium]